jgi:hypothetical protein
LRLYVILQRVARAHSTQIEHEIDLTFLAGQALDKPQRLGSTLLGLPPVDRAGEAVQYGRGGGWGARCFNHTRKYTRPPL